MTVNLDKTVPLYGYVALFNGRRAEIYAGSQYAAYLKAVTYFKPAKSKKHLVTVHLAELPNGSTVTHHADF